MKWWVVVLPATVAVGCPSLTSAQFSPGPLSRAHETLEGNAQCTKCHAARGVAPEKCLACHTLLARRINGTQGLHAHPEYRDCRRCHVEHHGRDTNPVYWGSQGRAGFDHALTGYTLTGPHRRLGCEQCHQRHQPRAAAELAAGAAGPRTFLGLESACLSCHPDVHQGQFKGRDCGVCHAQEAWKPASRFDHGRAAYRLEGRHVSVPCEKCHPVLLPAGPRPRAEEPGLEGPAATVAAAKVSRRFVGLTFGECSTCHRDPHEGRLGAGCAGCHDVAGWHPRRMAAFNHDRTGYPLRGRHARVACEGCHRPGAGYKLPHTRCADCHADAHFGQLATRPDHGACESCHDVQGFIPANYGVSEHASTRYPLEGAHLAVACATCHTAVRVASLRRPPDAATKLAPLKGATTIRLRFEGGTRCQDCHADRHAGEVDRYLKLKPGGCEGCHVVEAWSKVSRFDHAQTKLPLDGAHTKVACARCHVAADPGTPREHPRLRGLTTTCQGCHQDQAHAGQLVRDGAAPACERCHTTSDWKATRFNHQRDSTYALDGAHVKLPCSACHKRETQGGVTIVRLRPLGTKCRDCHVRPSGATEVTS